MMLLANSSSTEVERGVVLWKEMKEGNEFAFREIFDTYSNLLFQYGITISKERELVKDCVQELFVTIWTNRQSIGVARSIKYYLFFSLRRLLLKKISRARKFFALSIFHNRSFIIDAHDQTIFRREATLHHRLLISGAMESLPARQKEIIFLKFYQDLKNEEIQKIMNLNNQVVRNTLYKALNSLRKQIGKRKMSIQFLLFLAFMACTA